MPATPKALELFDAYGKSMLPNKDGFIISSFFSQHSTYTRYEIVSYNNVKSIYPSGDGLTFQTDGKKLYILVEPQGYPKKSEEPYCRSSTEQIPLRFSELESYTAKNQTRIYYGRQSVISYGAFTISKPTGINFSFVFFHLPDMIPTIQSFFEKTLNKETDIPLSDAKKVSKAICEKVATVMSWDYQKD
ncbi:MAG: hypothetical protein NT080_05790 [Spirochaetes bacterium]|nr:hypothetical protein [Spirochaetota bacterium]